MRKIFLSLFTFAICIAASSNEDIQLKAIIDGVIKGDPRNEGIEVNVYAEESASILIYDLRGVSDKNSMADVFRVFLQFADKTKEVKYKTIKLAFRNKIKFIIEGEYFQKLGREHSVQNPVYTIRTFPEHLLFPDGKRAYSSWTGGLIGVAQKQMEDFNDFHKKWYLNDLIERME